ncbi:MAG TPA: STAS/SEC14 domain-containing protein [Usitatibacter sp.]|jgi:hypothetical protein|nr:STAS/SEC14 domain-containing protein [Usitatibacter sp.]
MANDSAPGPDNVHVDLRDGIVWVEIRGDVSFQDSMRAMKEAAGAARLHGSDRLLFDIRGTRHREFHATTLESARLAPDLGLNTALRCAVVGDEADRQRLAFIEDVAANRGFKARTFTDVAEAVAWLKAGRP